jgi:hypothetical protein
MRQYIKERSHDTLGCVGLGLDTDFERDLVNKAAGLMGGSEFVELLRTVGLSRRILLLGGSNSVSYKYNT